MSERDEDMDLNDLMIKVMGWFEERNLIDGSNAKAQFSKTLEEVEELREALEEDAPIKVVDAIGDVVVTLIGVGLQYGLTMNECLNHAWNEIKDRKGKMVDGVFVKDE